MLEIKNLHAARRRQGNPQGHRPDRQRRRSARHHGAERLRQEHAGAGAGRPRRATRSPAARCCSTARTCWSMAPEERAREGVFLAFQYPVEIPGVSNIYFLQGGAQRRCASTAARRSWTRWSSCSWSREKMKLVRDGRGAAEPPGQRGLLRRREEAQRDLPDGGARAAAGHPRRDRLGPRHRRPAHRRRRRERAARAGARDARDHPLPAAAQLHRAGLRARAGRRPHRQVGRQGAGAGAGGEGLRLDRERAGRRQPEATPA